MANPASRLIQRFANAVQTSRLGRLKLEEKTAVLALLNAVALADGVMSPEELASFDALSVKAGISRPTSLPLPEAVAILAKNPGALKLACLLVADAFFADGDYDANEKAFVASFSQRFNLGENPLKAAVESLRKKKLDAALASWNDEIEKD